MAKIKQTRKPKQKRKQTERKVPKVVPVMSGPRYDNDCLTKLAQAACQPFVHTMEPLCLPDQHSQKSFKQRSYMRGSAEVGINGIGFILVRPALVNDKTNVTATGSTYNGTASTLISASPVGGVQYVDNSLAFEESQLSGAVGGNMVGKRVLTSLRVRFMGSRLNASGKFMLASPRTDAIDIATNASFTYANTGLYDNCRHIAINERPGKWYTITSLPKSDDELFNANLPYSLICHFSCPASSLVDFEVVTHTELRGKFCENFSTETPTVNQSVLADLLNTANNLGSTLGAIPYESLLKMMQYGYALSRAYNQQSRTDRKSVV